jgi:AAA domain-containing protein
MPIQLSKVPTDKNFRALFIGPTGRGKTIAASSWPGKTLIVDFDHRHKPVIDWFPERLDEISIEVIYPRNYWDTFVPLINDLESGKLRFDNVSIDGITTLSNTTVVMQMIAKGMGPEKGKITKGGVAVPSWDEFNGEAMLITQLLETLKSIRCNLFVTAHPVQKTRIEGTKSIRETSIISFGTKLAPMVPTYFDEVYAFDYEFDINSGKPVKRYVYTAPTADYPDVKSALKGLPPRLDITGKNLYDVMKEYL